MKNVLAAVDFSEISQKVLESAATFTKGSQGHLWLIHVAPPDPDFAGYEAGPRVVRDQVAKHLRDEHRRLQAMAEEQRGHGIDTTALLVQGPTVETILKEAEKLEAEMIVVGSHGRGALLRALLGSTSQGIIQKTEVPVLIVPARALATD